MPVFWRCHQLPTTVLASAPEPTPCLTPFVSPFEMITEFGARSASFALSPGSESPTHCCDRSSTRC